ncbi:MAG: sensor histidine kinase [Proteobacteria bacterium]|nr:sensor histidine kinase [Pseudomonadota bacterium]MBU1058577.1 sensor histidine kinase [Pseudomonadota bacterium]
MLFPNLKSFIRNAQKEQVNVTLPWLLALRWGAVLCQIVLIIAVWLVMDIDIPLLPVSTIILFEGASNIYLHIRHEINAPVSNQLILLILLMDTVFLTGLLHVTGAAMNPFVFLYLIHIVTGALILQEKCSWLITATTIACYSLLFYFPPSFISALSEPHIPKDANDLQLIDNLTDSIQLQLKGMGGAFIVTSIFIVFFVSKSQKALTQHRIKIQSLEKERERHERLASLATFAAGAAHELSTPLSTVAVVSCEMIHYLKEHGESGELLDDALLIRRQVADCKEILYQMAAGAGEHLGEEIREFPIQEAVSQILEEIKEEDRRRLRVTIEPEDLQITMPFRSLCRTIKGLVKNGLEASSPPEEVSMRWFTTYEHLGVEICDPGTGIEEQLESQVTEPFFTTKDSGLGLGLFLAKSMAEQFGGDLIIELQSEQGTRVTLTLALEMIRKNYTNIKRTE